MRRAVARILRGALKTIKEQLPPPEQVILYELMGGAGGNIKVLKRFAHTIHIIEMIPELAGQIPVEAKRGKVTICPHVSKVQDYQFTP